MERRGCAKALWLGQCETQALLTGERNMRCTEKDGKPGRDERWARATVLSFSQRHLEIQIFYMQRWQDQVAFGELSSSQVKKGL